MWVTVVWRRELGVLVNWTDILDGEIVNAARGVARMVARPRTSRRGAVDLDTAARDALTRIAADSEISDLPEVEVAELTAALTRHEVQGALQALLAVLADFFARDANGRVPLPDTSRRRAVSERVEHFCSAYPLTPVLVTSRVVGYDEARLDDSQFDCYRLVDFSDDQVAEYAHKWFAAQTDSATKAERDAATFLRDSTVVRDLRTSPLLLSLLCLLYLGGASLPRDRVGVYAKCTELLLRGWDKQRDLFWAPRAVHLVEPMIAHLAWQLFTSADARKTLTEREIVTRTTEFLCQRRYGSADESRLAARELADLCTGRTWVLSDVGTTGDGERLYAFTHRTFLEYFAAAHLAASYGTPEALARALAPRMKDMAWDVVGELAIALPSGRSNFHRDPWRSTTR